LSGRTSRGDELNGVLQSSVYSESEYCERDEVTLGGGSSRTNAS